MVSMVSGAFRTGNLVRHTGMPLLLPLYHVVSNSYLPHVSPLYAYRTAAAFEADLEFLLKHFQPVLLSDLMEYPNPNKAFDRPVFHLTFDDGMREVFEVVWPILKKYGVTATLFVNPDFLDNKTLFYRHKAALIIDGLKKADKATQQQLTEVLKANKCWQGSLVSSAKQLSFRQQEVLDQLANILQLSWDAFLQQQKPYLTTQQVQMMMEEGLTVGAHSMNHPLYNDIPVPAQIQQTQDSLTWIQQTFGLRYKAFAFPFTDAGVKAGFFESMYQYGVDVSFGTAGLKTEQWPRHLHRLPMEIAGCSAQTIVNTEYLYFWLKKPLNKNQVHRS